VRGRRKSAVFPVHLVLFLVFVVIDY
jgi:hypothetical protein